MKIKTNRRYFYAKLAVWFSIGVLLAVLSIFACGLLENLAQPSALSLVGIEAYILGLLLLVFTVDVAYLVLFVNWLYFGHKKGSKQDKLVLP
jgi:hypothetical protein